MPILRVVNWRKLSRMSIRYKLMILLVALPVATLGLYLFVAKNLFESDKVAYVFDSSATVTRQLAGQVRSRLSNAASGVNLLLGDFQPGARKGFGAVARRLFDADREVQLVRAFPASGGAPLGELRRDGAPKDVVEAYAAAAPRLVAATRASEGQGVAVEPVPGDGGYFALAVRPKGARTVAVSLHRWEDLHSVFRKKQFYAGYVVAADGRVLLAPPKDSGWPEIPSFGPWKFYKDLLRSNIPAGTTEAPSPDGVKILASYAQVGLGELRVVALVRKAHALRAVDALLLKSVLFFVALAASATIVSVFASGGLTSTLRKLNQGTQRVAEGDFAIRVEAETEDEVGNLARSFNRMAEEVSRLMAETASKARMEKELETARAVQETLFPASDASIGPLRISGYYEPAGECGGDWWHYCEIGDKVFLWIGDATGHGVPAALVTSAAKSAATILEKLASITPGRALTHLNRAIHSTAKGGIMMTFFVASFDRKTGELTYACAGHDPPYLMRDSGKPLTRKDLVPLNDVNDLRLGEDPNVVYKEAKVRLQPGDQVVFYTDGVYDVTSPEGAGFGEKNFQKLVAQSFAPEAPMGDFIGKVRENLQGHRGGTELPDDITFFSCRYEKAA